MVLHINLMARGTCPHSFIMQLRSLSETFGSNVFTNSAEEASSRTPTLSRWMGSLWLKSLWDSREVTRRFMWLHLTRSSSISLRTSCLTWVSLDSSKSSALSKIRTKGDRHFRKHWMSRSEGDTWSASLASSNIPSRFETKSCLVFNPRRDVKYTGIFLSRNSCATWMATEVFPNPGGPQTSTSRVDPSVNWSKIFLLSSLRPTKCGILSGIHDSGNGGP